MINKQICDALKQLYVQRQRSEKNFKATQREGESLRPKRIRLFDNLSKQKIGGDQFKGTIHSQSATKLIRYRTISAVHNYAMTELGSGKSKYFAQSVSARQYFIILRESNQTQVRSSHARIICAARFYHFGMCTITTWEAIWDLTNFHFLTAHSA